MNFLAHFYLSPQIPEILVGGFLGDFVKGKQYQAYAPEVQRGILLHREIDRYTDAHPVFRHSKHRLSLRYGHYAGVIVDIFYDYLLASQWAEYSDQSLPSFAQKIYATLAQYQPILPSVAQRVLEHMSTHDWLSSYASPEGISQALRGMQQRARFPNQMGEATAELLQDYPFYAREFAQFFPDIQRQVAGFPGQ